VLHNNGTLEILFSWNGEYGLVLPPCCVLVEYLISHCYFLCAVQMEKVW